MIDKLLEVSSKSGSAELEETECDLRQTVGDVFDFLVPQAQAAGLKAKLLQEQYSQNKSSFSGYFERVGALSTQYDRRVAKLESLTEEIRSTIRQFPGVRDAQREHQRRARTGATFWTPTRW